MNRERPDVLLVSPGTTEGWRRADSELADVLRELGVSVSVVGSEMRFARHFRRTMQLTDLAEAAAMRRALSRALRRTSPRAILFSTTQATMLQPGRRLRGAAVRFDALAAVNRPGRANALQHRLERRALARAAMLLPWGLDPAQRVPSELRARGARGGAAGGDRRSPSSYGAERRARSRRGRRMRATPTRRGSSWSPRRGAWPRPRAGAWS